MSVSSDELGEEIRALASRLGPPWTFVRGKEDGHGALGVEVVGLRNSVSHAIIKIWIDGQDVRISADGIVDRAVDDELVLPRAGRYGEVVDALCRGHWSIEDWDLVVRLPGSRKPLRLSLWPED